MENSKKCCLIILDGWGHANISEKSAIDQADTPFINSLYENYPNAELVTFGEEVGLPKGQMGNSEVGHLNIGAGRIVFQALARINNAIDDGSINNNPVLLQAINKAKANDKAIHLMGLVSDGGVHSHINHLKALVDLCESAGIKKTFIHAFMDGRDTDPQGGESYISDLLDHLKGKEAKLSTMIGRYFAMDRDQRWERIQKAYDLLVHGKASIITNEPLAALSENYKVGISDEFMVPILMNGNNSPDQLIKDGDTVICFNFRTDRPRQITTALTQKDFPENNMQKLALNFVSMTQYDASYENIDVVFANENLKNTIGAVVSEHNKTQLRIAETEKYPHVTFFFNGGREEPYDGESRIVIKSPNVATYDLQPEMSAYEVTAALDQAVKKDEPHLVVVNFANTDMVGHTGIMDAAIKSAETVDECLSKIVPVLQQLDYSVIVIADHGNADIMVTESGKPHTAHTTNPVPIIVISDQVQAVNEGKLADIAPTILHLMGIPSPSEMTGDILV